MTRARKALDWVQLHGAWIAILLLAAGTFGYGYCLATIQARSDRAAEITATTEAYRTALAAKDRLINQLAGSAVMATGQAADAAATASQAADTATQAADKATTAVDNAKALQRLK